MEAGGLWTGQICLGSDLHKLQVLFTLSIISKNCLRFQHRIVCDPIGHVVPLRANRNLFLPLWNNVDYSGEDWRKAPPTDEEEEEEEEEDSEEGGAQLFDLKRKLVSLTLSQIFFVLFIKNKSLCCQLFVLT